MAYAGPISEREWADLRRQSTTGIDDVIGAVGLPAVLLPYQSRAVALLESAACRVLYIEKSRRIGMTWGLAAYIVLRAARARSAGGMDAMYISYSQEMTREFVDACAMWAKAFAIAAGDVGEFLFDDASADDPSDTRQIKAFRIQFASGFEVIALSSAPRTLRGKQGVVVIDEAAFVDDLKRVITAAMAYLMWGGQVIVCSTHNGADNFFAEEIQEILAGRSPYKHMHCDFDEALRDGLYQRICLVTKKDWSPEAEAKWRQEIIAFYRSGADEELFCIPAEGAGVWLARALIEARMTATAPVLRWELPGDYLQRSESERKALFGACLDELDAALAGLDPHKRHALGFDFGRVGHLSVAWALARDDHLNLGTALVVEMRRFPHREQIIVCDRITKALPRPLGEAYDATGEGNVVAEEMQRRFGVASDDPDVPGGLVAAIKLTQEWYRLNMPPLKAAFEDGTLSIVRDAYHLDDLRVVEIIRGIPQVPKVDTGAVGATRHADAAVALALARFAATMNAMAYGYTPVPPPRGRFDVGGGDDDVGSDTPYRLAGMRRSRGIF